MVFSKELMRQLRPGLTDCVKNLLTEHEDIELGRCVQRATKVQCATAWSARRVFFQNYDKGSYANNIINPSEEQIDEGAVFHANKDPEYQRHFHSLVLKWKINKLLKKISDLQNELQPKEDPVQSVIENAMPTIEWSSAVQAKRFTTGERVTGRVHKRLDYTLKQDESLFLSTIADKSWNVKQVGRNQFYYVVNPLKSFDVISKLQLSGWDTSKSSSFRVNSYMLQRRKFPKDTVYLRETDITLPASVNSEAKGTPINFLVALSGRPGNFIRFLDNFESTFLSRGENVNLIVCYFPSKPKDQLVDAQNNGADDEDGATVRRSLEKLQSKYPEAFLQTVFMPTGTDFSRGVGLQKAAESVKDPNEIIFFCDVDLVFSVEILMHIRRNTIQRKRVYYPVFFSQYDPESVYANLKRPESHFHFDELDGFWRHFSYGMVSLYKSDFMKTKGFDLSLRGWGLEDLHMVDGILEAGLDIFKSTEPAEVHVYHDKFCDPNVLGEEQLDDCRKSRAQHFGPKALLYYLWMQTMDEEVVEGDEQT